MKPTDLDGIARKIQHIFFVIDTSGILTDNLIGQINKAICDTIELLKQHNRNIDTLLKVAILEFNTTTNWFPTNGPQNILNLNLTHPFSAGGLTELGAALTELGSKLSREKFLSSKTGQYLPIIFFISSGDSTDNYKKALEEINKNSWFLKAKKIAFAIGDYPDCTALANITGDSNYVLKVEKISFLPELITFVCTTSSTPKQMSGMAFPGDTPFLRQLHCFVEELGGVSIATDEDIEYSELLETAHNISTDESWEDL